MATTPWNEPRISPSKLGAFVAPGFCELCAWRTLRLNFRKPFVFPMPAILTSLDAQHKQLATVALDRRGMLPEYFGDFQDATEILEIESIDGFHAETNLVLYGKPDLVLQDKDGAVSVIDNKTAKSKALDHPLTAMYKLQVNMYGYLLENCPKKYNISRIGLLYYEFEPLADDAVLKHVGKNFMMARFKPVLVEVDYDPTNVLEPVFKKVRELMDMEEPPDGNDGCKDCILLAAFHDIASVTDGIRPPRRNDRDDMNRFRSETFLVQHGLCDERQAKFDALSKGAEPGGFLDLWLRDEDQ